MTASETVHAALDTNVLASALLKPQSVPGKIIAAVQTGRLRPAVSGGILAEYSEVLFRRKFNKPHEATKLLLLMLRLGEYYRLPHIQDMPPMPDSDDVVFYATALAARKVGKNAYLVTGNLKHFPPEDFVVSPRAMLEILGGLP